MSTKLYVIRHCRAQQGLTLNDPDTPLTREGVQQAKLLGEFLQRQGVGSTDNLLSSPYRRACETANIIAEKLQLSVSINDKLKELNLGNVSRNEDIGAILAELRVHFEHPEKKFPQGESNHEVQQRVSELVDQLLRGGEQQTHLLVTHQITMTLLLQRYDARFGFETCMELTNPDVFLIEFADGEVQQIRHIWT
ncbi:histidine phosphatase family protein [Paenibacillus profundus]|uniref:Histidine phosphatase family protein n=1 Tax=Paenibacillus profundus TaxID=1173085 RepID=A0ABS8YK59_9BACL|nr:histidine phosphatase family protein [Paenibacillus profundus]MCE5172265.1 histidine phosphatase family protein [Paenibacillus profundus]